MTHALPPELMDLDLDVALGCEYGVVRSTSNLVPLVQIVVMVKHGQPLRITWLPLTVSLVYRTPMKP